MIPSAPITLAAAAVTAAALAGSAHADTTCPTAELSGRFDAVVERQGRHDADRLDRAVLHYTNRARCRHGLRPLSASRRLSRAAERHSGDMARLSFFGHDSPVPGYRTLRDRIEASGAPAEAAAENLIEAYFMNYVDGTRFRVIDARRCQFRTEVGRALFRHTYRSMAQSLVERWMESPGHRRNILMRGATRHGFGIAANRKPELCGGIYATQLFVG